MLIQNFQNLRLNWKEHEGIGEEASLEVVKTEDGRLDQ